MTRTATSSDATARRSEGRAPTEVFILGAGRSGTTLVYKGLCLHPDVGWISNYLEKWPRHSFLAALNYAAKSVPGLREWAWFGKKGNAYSGRRWMRRLVPTPVEGESVYAECAIPVFPEPGWQISSGQLRCLRETTRRITRLQRARVFVSKRTANNRRIPQLHEAFPDARFIHIVRDGRAVARSLLKVDWWNDHKVWWWHQQTPREWARQGGDPLELAARNWVEEMREIEAGLKAVPSALILSVRYERLIQAPLQTWQAMAEFAGLRPTNSWVQQLGRLRLYEGNAAAQGAGGDRVSEIQSDTLRRFGYEA